MKIRVENFYNKTIIGDRVFIKNEDTPFTGVLIYKYSNNTLKEEENYVDGLLDGKSKKYFSNGELKECNEFREGKLEGESLQFYENGNIKEYIQFKDNKIDGEWIQYYIDGTIRVRSF